MLRYAFAAAALAAAGSATSATPPRASYDVTLTLSEDGAMFANPRLTTGAGQPATFQSDDGKGNSWRAELTATPDAARPGQIAVDWSLTLTRALPKGEISRRSMRTALSLRDPGHAALDVPANVDVRAVHVVLGVATLPPQR